MSLRPTYRFPAASAWSLMWCSLTSAIVCFHESANCGQFTFPKINFSFLFSVLPLHLHLVICWCVVVPGMHTSKSLSMYLNYGYTDASDNNWYWPIKAIICIIIHQPMMRADYILSVKSRWKNVSDCSNSYCVWREFSLLNLGQVNACLMYLPQENHPMFTVC